MMQAELDLCHLNAPRAGKVHVTFFFFFFSSLLWLRRRRRRVVETFRSHQKRSSRTGPKGHGRALWVLTVTKNLWANPGACVT